MVAWQTPKTNWTAQDVVTPADLNRIEGNEVELKKADTIDIVDAGGKFTATNVEDALQELATDVQTGKDAVASAITAMGQSASGSDSFSTLASKVRAISTDATAVQTDVRSGETFYAGGTKETGTATVVNDFFGDGSDGALDTSEDVTFSVTAHTGLVVKQYTSITINAGHTVTVDNPCRGLVLYCQGNVVINGTIDMSKKAGLGVSELPPIPITKLKSGGAAALQYYNQLATVLQSLKGGAGGNGGTGGTGIEDNPNGGAGGTGGTGRLLAGGFGGGGGGGGVGNTSGLGGDGGDILYADLGGSVAQPLLETRVGGNPVIAKGTPGVNGGGGMGAWHTTSSTNRTPSGGGAANGGGGGGGGAQYNSSATVCGGDGEYAGGFVLIIAGGDITIGSGAYIKANGGNGGAGSDAGGTYAGGGGGGGGAGGGVVALLYAGAYSNSGTIQVNGGTGGAGGAKGTDASATTGSAGTSGSAGTIYTQQLT